MVAYNRQWLNLVLRLIHLEIRLLDRPYHCSERILVSSDDTSSVVMVGATTLQLVTNESKA